MQQIPAVNFFTAGKILRQGTAESSAPGFPAAYRVLKQPDAGEVI